MPGIAEGVAPLLGGVTTRDATDLVALLVLPVLGQVLHRNRPGLTRRAKRVWMLLGVLTGVLATTATASSWPFGELRQVAAAEGTFYVEVAAPHALAPRWLASHDGGRSWALALAPPPLSPVAEADSGSWTDCADDGACYRARVVKPEDPNVGEDQQLLERRAADSDWAQEAEIDSYVRGIAVNHSDSAQAVVIGWDMAHYREPTGTWREVDLIALADGPGWFASALDVIGDPMSGLILLVLLSVVGWLSLPQLSEKWLAQICLLAIGSVGALFQLVLWINPVHPGWLNLLWAGATLGAIWARRWWWIRRRRRQAASPPPLS